MAHRIHVAVLDTDVPCLSVYTKRGLYSSQFRVLLQSAAARLNKNTIFQNGPLSVHVTAFDAVGGSLPPLECLRTTPFSPTEPYSPLGAIDAILITGSIGSAYDSDPWIKELESYIQIIHSTYPHVKLFGSCFGHQLIAQALLSADKTSPESSFHVEKSSKSFEIGIHPITLSESFTSHFPVFNRSPFRIQLIHGDIVVPTPSAKSLAAGEVSLPSPWMSIGKSAACDIQGLYCPGRVLSYQGHFEFDTFSNRELCMEFARRANWSPELVESYVEQIERSQVPGSEDDDDAKAAAEAVLLFFASEDQAVKSVSGLSGTVVNGMLTPPLEG